MDQVLRASDEVDPAYVAAYERASSPKDELLVAAYLGDVSRISQALARGAPVRRNR